MIGQVELDAGSLIQDVLTVFVQWEEVEKLAIFIHVAVTNISSHWVCSLPANRG